MAGQAHGRAWQSVFCVAEQGVFSKVPSPHTPHAAQARSVDAVHGDMAYSVALHLVMQETMGGRGERREGGGKGVDQS